MLYFSVQKKGEWKDLMREKLSSFFESLKQVLTDEQQQRTFVLQWINRLLAVVSAMMTVVNILTGKRVLMWSTLIFALLCVVNVILSTRSKKGLRISSVLLACELIVLFTFFLISGEPEGFAVNWICLMPAFAFLLYGSKNGAYISAFMLGVLVFLLWIPAGRALIRYDGYSESFFLRYPFLYTAAFFLSFFLSQVINFTQKELRKRNTEYAYLYNHDPLTGLYNRYGMKTMISKRPDGPMTVFMLDLDFFKKTNDEFGHMYGDIVLKAVSGIIADVTEGYGVAARWGGEEFVIISFDPKDPREIAKAICDKVRAAQVKIPNSSGIARLTVSIGIAQAPDAKTAELDHLLYLSDNKLYEAKKAGRDRYMM